MRILLVLLLLSVGSYSQPQPQQSQPHESKAESKKADQGRTPAPAVINQSTHDLPATNTNPEQGKDVKAKDSNDERIAAYTQKLASYTLALDVVTGILGFIGILQFVALIWQAKTLTHHSRLLTHSVRQMGRTVRAYRRLGDLTMESNEITRDATDLTMESVILTHRPKLIVRNIVIKEPTSMSFLGSGGDPSGVRIIGQLYVSNIGGTRARILEVYSMFTIGALPMGRPYETLNGRPVDIRLLPGQSSPIIIPTNDEIFDGKDSPIPLKPGDTAAYVMGWIDYLDDNGNSRRTAFCRQWNVITKRFHTIDDPDYEHAE